MKYIRIPTHSITLTIVMLAWAASASAQQTGAVRDSVVQAENVEHHAASAQQRTRWSFQGGAASSILELDSLAAKPLGTFSSVLSSRIPGMLVQQPSGSAGAAARIHIRGLNSLVLPGDPLVFVDGVRVANATTNSTVQGSAQALSALDALDPEEIARIEVLPGAAAAALYGGDATDGVVLITTRHGQTGRPVWRLHTQYGAIHDITSYPANYWRVGTNPSTGQPVALCTLDLEYQGGCMPGPLTTWNPLENVSPFHAGAEQRHGLSVGGGSGALTYYAAGDFDRVDGVYADNEQLQTHVRAVVSDRIARTLGVTVTTRYVDGMVRLPNDGGALADGLFGSAVDDPITRGYRDSLTYVLHNMQPPEHTHQYSLGLTAKWEPLGWLRSLSTVGYDRLHLGSDHRDVIIPSGGGDTTVSKATGAYWTDALDVRSDVEASYGDAAALSASSIVGLRYHRGRAYDRADVGVQSLRSGSPPLTSGSVTELHGHASTTGLYVQQQLVWRQRLVFTGGLRHDRQYHALVPPSDRTPTLTHGSASVSWLMSSEPFFPNMRWLDALHLRAAYGQTSRYLDPVILPPATFLRFAFASDAPPFAPAPPARVAPEHMREMEAGLDLTLLHDRVDASLTYYDKHSMHLAMFGPYLGSSGSGIALLQDAGEVRSHGYEMALHMSPVRTHAVTTELALAGATTHNTLISRRPPFILSGTAPAGDVQYVKSGYPAAGYWGRRFTFADANGDGIISRDEVQMDSTTTFLGSATPTRELSIAPSLRLSSGITLSALVDYRGGFRRYDANNAYRCRSMIRGNCRGAYDATAPLVDQAATVASDLGSDAGFVDDATFWRLREVAVTFAAPHRWARHLAASDVHLTLAGRNLATWTRYPGLDPEINANPTDPLMQNDLATQPPMRYLTARVDVTW